MELRSGDVDIVNEIGNTDWKAFIPPIAESCECEDIS
jgi:hypothetical protein